MSRCTRKIELAQLEDNRLLRSKQRNEQCRGQFLNLDVKLCPNLHESFQPNDYISTE